jgi:TetR/AcrR family transcriptional repressor of nem operon
MEKDQREALLDAGLRVVHARGLAATGVRDIAMAGGVPQGSFTNHFRSKEAFGFLVLDRYVERIDAIMRETLGDDTRAPADRLMAYIDRIAESAAEAEWRRGCMVPDLAGEIAFHDDALRALSNPRSSKRPFAWLGLTTKPAWPISAPSCSRPRTECRPG